MPRTDEDVANISEHGRHENSQVDVEEENMAVSPIETVDGKVSRPITDVDKDITVTKHDGQVFPEIKSILDTKVQDSPPIQALNTLTQFQNTVHSGVDMNVGASSIS
ncbi:hypothetical protein KC19_VG090900 [Ceratodon purpureus]|uniref:Uncharacterized protein n=1 Tax=Ceratodon purpureus TaxID=3225 RepID=A0A8T0HNN8_CERPU|nr:hypothetical protein KC19_VG090900 [Ceratodon purpureus]